VRDGLGVKGDREGKWLANSLPKGVYSPGVMSSISHDLRRSRNRFPGKLIAQGNQIIRLNPWF